MTAKERHRRKLLETLTYWTGDWPQTKSMAQTILGLANSQQIYDYFTPDEILKIKIEAKEAGESKNDWVEEERKADLAMLKKAQKGDPQAYMAYQKVQKGFQEKWKGEIIPIEILNAPIEKKDQPKLPVKGVKAITEGEENKE